MRPLTDKNLIILIYSKFSNGLKVAEDLNPGVVLEMKNINFTRKFSEDAQTELCNVLKSDRFVAIIDMTWGGWIKVRTILVPGLFCM